MAEIDKPEEPNALAVAFALAREERDRREAAERELDYFRAKSRRKLEAAVTETRGGFPVRPARPAIAQDAKPKPEPEPTPTASPVFPNAGIRAAYQRKLERLIDEMGRSFMHWLKAAYRANEPAMAMDAVPAKMLQAAIDDLTRQWRRRFDEAAPDLARFFARSTSRQSDAALRAILKRGGFTVQFRMTPAMRDILAATVQENVQLIKSIPEQFLTQVQGSVMRSVIVGRDVGALTKELQRNFGVTRKRAALISLDQNNKATSALQRARQTELGIETGVWLHSKGGKEPRPTHLDNSGKTFSIAEGWFDPDPKVRKRIWPGELIRCRCVWKPVIKGFE